MVDTTEQIHLFLDPPPTNPLISSVTVEPDYGSTHQIDVLPISEATTVSHIAPRGIPGLPSSQQIVTRAKQRFQHQRQELLHDTTTPPPTIERKRDWSIGFITGHRLLTLVSLSLLMYDEYWLQDYLWPDLVNANASQQWFARCSVFWLAAFLPSVLGLIGVLMYHHNDRLDEVPPTPHLVVWRIVSRGTNSEALAATVLRVRNEMEATPLFPYLIEVVTDVSTNLEPAEDLLCLTVPKSYQTPKRTKYKARALHYAIEFSPVPDKAWLVHLDEETQPTSSAIKGIAAMVTEEEESGQLRIGQGALLYHRNWKKYPFLTLADTMRTGDDFARFYLQHRIGISLFGLHGSYIVCRNDLECSIGFDFGPVGSITEDAFWSLCCLKNGARSRWVNGYLEEQSTQSLMDFLRQRRRWYNGLALVSLHAPVEVQYRLSLVVTMILWTIAPISTLYTILNIFLGCNTNGVIRAIANFSLSFYATLYLLGVEANMAEHGMKSILARAKWYVLLVILLPCFSFMESLAVFYALLRPDTGFHVVRK